MIISEKNAEKAKQLIKKSTEKPLIVEAQDDAFNRSLLEYGKFDVLLSPEIDKKRSSVRQENSGFNHVLAKIASKNNIAIGINLEEISKLPKKEKAERIAKLMQNIKIARKTKTKIVFINDKKINKRMRVSLLLSLGASTQQI